MSDLVIIRNGDLVTTTSAIAAGTANTHEAVIRLVRTHQGDFEEFGGVRFEIEPFETAGGQQKREIALLNEDQATLLITYMRNNVVVRKFKIALVRSFAEMRKRLASPQIPDFMNPAAAARAWADELEAKQLAVAKVEQLEHQVAEQAPAVAGFERIASADGAMCVTDAAKTLQIQPHKLRDALLQMAWIYRRQGKSGYVAYQDKIHAGYLKHRMGEYQDPETGERKTNPQVLVTSKGIAHLAKLLSTNAPAPSPGRSPRRLN
jgi:anti-repressor protein